VAKFTTLLNNNNNNNNCQTTWSRELFGKIQKNCHISKKKVMKWPRYFGGFGLDFQLSSFEIAIYLSKFRF
jgi:hypothetical protein